MRPTAVPVIICDGAAVFFSRSPTVTAVLRRQRHLGPGELLGRHRDRSQKPGVGHSEGLIGLFRSSSIFLRPPACPNEIRHPLHVTGRLREFIGPVWGFVGCRILNPLRDDLVEDAVNLPGAHSVNLPGAFENVYLINLPLHLNCDEFVVGCNKRASSCGSTGRSPPRCSHNVALVRPTSVVPTVTQSMTLSRLPVSSILPCRSGASFHFFSPPCQRPLPASLFPFLLPLLRDLALSVWSPQTATRVSALFFSLCCGFHSDTMLNPLRTPPNQSMSIMHVAPTCRSRSLRRFVAQPESDISPRSLGRSVAHTRTLNCEIDRRTPLPQVVGAIRRAN